MIVAMAAAAAVFMAVSFLLDKFMPTPPPGTAGSDTSTFDPGPPPPDSAETPPGPQSAEPESRPGAQPKPQFTNAQAVAEPIKLGSDETGSWKLMASFSQRGASIDTLRFTERKSNGDFIHRVDTKGNEAYPVLEPVADGDRTAFSFATDHISIEEFGDQNLIDVIWQLDSRAAGKVVFSTTLTSPNEADQPLLKLIKSFELAQDSMLIYLRMSVENLSDRTLKVRIAHNGPLGITKENLRWNMRRVFAAYRTTDGAIELVNKQRDKIKSSPEKRILMGSGVPDGVFVWTALANKYFAVFTRPVTADNQPAKSVMAATAVLGAPTQTEDKGDAMVRLYSHWQTVAPGQSVRQDFEICTSPKDHDELKKINPQFTEVNQPGSLGYISVRAADRSCFCAFEPLPSLMKGLLNWIHFVVRNYGVAIIILVIIIRSCLHPLTVFQQKSMYRMQEAMGRVQPKMQAIKEKWANDKVRMNQETMKLWSEENVNPMGSMVSMIPMFIQMPILVALWTALNTDVHLRNAPFDGWWITDLSRPDALIDFGPGGWDVPLLSLFPLIGGMFSDIPSFNLLPIFMGVSMWLQQKYMPKPGMKAKLEAAKKAKEAGQKPPPPGKGIEDQLRQQKMMANMMSVMFPLMFYYMPAGLNLYWLATNVFGIFESIIIRKQLEKEKKKGPPKGPKKPGMVSKFFKRMAEQAETLQKKADDISK